MSGDAPKKKRFARLRAFVKRHKKGLLITGAVLLVTGSFAGWKTWDYIQNDPNFCTSCHLMDDAFDRWKHSPHAQVNCHTCHPGDIASNLHQLWVQLTKQPKEVKKHAEVPAKICGQCHLADDDRWPQVAATSGHRVHWVEKKIECVECHAPAVHTFIPTDQMCARCHPTQVVGLTAMEQVHCAKCHDFLADSSRPLVAGEDRCMECHAGSVGGPTAPVWHDQVGCIGCHPVHDGATGTVAADPAAGPTRDREGRAVPCADCHTEEAALAMPAAHECQACHEPHAVPAGEAVCRDCHDEVASHLPERDHHACADCHTPHQPEIPAASQCVDCHGDDETLAAATPIEAHRTCEACHRPHEAGPPDGPACATCHVDAARKVASAPAGHQQCEGCHGIHEPDSTRACTACHTAEAAAAKTAPVPHQNCRGCHANHGEPRSGVSPCGRCHQKEVASARTQAAAHGQCADCHSPHAPAIPPISGCARCHAEEAGLVAGEGKTHQDCRSCHPWHQKVIAATGSTCQSCHADHKATAAAGPTHRDCASCHPPHRAGKPAACEACHVRQAPRPGEPKPHQDCTSCHGPTHARVNVAKTPCDGCHTTIAEAGLHRTPGHDDCLDCHGTHPVDRPSADRCARCHPPEKIRDHPAAAQGVRTCQGCHTFAGGGRRRGGEGKP
ncbi:MAG: NapC/NirT family cytochrome c [bacterium]